MAPESRRIPSWAQNERAHDIAWIGENLYILWPAAREGFERLGRGAILVDTTLRPRGTANPFIYAHEQMVEEMKDEDTLRMVRAYDPEREMVTTLLKPQERLSTYRILVVRR